MNPKLWAEITGAYEDASRRIATAFAERGKLPDLDALRARLRRRLDELLAALSPPLSAEDAVQVLVPLVFLLDEQVQARLAHAYPMPEWPLLQRDVFPDGDGGDVFYDGAAELLRNPDASTLLLGVYLYCLQAGFQGRLVDDPTAIPQWKAKLAARLPPAPALSAPAPTPIYRKARTSALYWAAVVGAVVLAQLVLLALARAL